MNDIAFLKNDSSQVIDPLELKNLAAQIAEVMFDNSEISTLEQKVDDALLEQVSRVLNRMELYPSQIRDAVQVLMEIQDSSLGIALLLQAFLIHSDLTLESVVEQLMRLSSSPNKKTANQTMKALREAAFSEIPRLQVVGCKALFGSGRLSGEELLGFAQSDITFAYRIESVNILTQKISYLSTKGFVDLVRAWDRFLSPDDKLRYKNQLFSLAGQFRQFQTAEKELIDGIVEELFNAVNDPSLSNPAKKFLQSGLASLPQNTVELIKGLDENKRFSPAVVFILGTCARRTPIATQELIDLAKEYLEDIQYSPYRGLKFLIWVGQQLERAKLEGCQNELDDLIMIVENEVHRDDGNEALAALRRAREACENGKKGKNFRTLLSEICTEFIDYPEMDVRDAMQLRFHFEREAKGIDIRKLPEDQRSVLVEAMRLTNEQNPWVGSADILMKNYHAFSDNERLILIDVLGAAALHQRGITESRTYRGLRDFIQNISKEGKEAEQTRANEWNARLTGEVLPSG